MAYSNKDKNRDKAQDFKRIKDPSVRLQRQKALELCNRAGFDLRKGGGLDELRQFQDFLTSYTITVFRRNGKEVFFSANMIASSS